MEKVAVYYTSKINSENSKLDLFRIDEWCKKNNYDYTLFVDEVKSRNITKNRLEMNRLKNELEKGAFKKVIISNLTNLSNDMIFNLNFITFIERNNSMLIILDGFDPRKIKPFYNKNFKNIEEERERWIMKRKKEIQ